jgi:WD40 repeat protein
VTLAWSSDGALLASGAGLTGFGGGGELIIWDTPAREPIHVISHQLPIRPVRWSPDSALLLSGSGDYYGAGGAVVIWDAITGQAAMTLTLPELVQNAFWLPDGTRFVATTPDTVGLWDAQDGDALADLKGRVSLSTFTWSPDGTTLIPRSEADPAPDPLHAQSPDGTLMAVVSDNGLISIEDAATGVSVAMLQGFMGQPVYDLAWSPDGRLIAAGADPLISSAYGGGWGPNLMVWEAATGQPLYSLEGHWGVVYSVEWSPDSTLLASGGGSIPAHMAPTFTGWDANRIMVWDAATGALRHVFRGHFAEVLELLWSQDSRALASGSADGTILIWDIAP